MSMGIGINIAVNGLRAVKKEMQKSSDLHKRALANAVLTKAFQIDADAVKRVPVLTGRLRATHYVRPMNLRETEPFTEVGFGTNYAAYVHELTESQHSIGESKYLANAVLKFQRGWEASVAKWTKRYLKGGKPTRGGVPSKPKDVD